jgi:hypothetical protein
MATRNVANHGRLARCTEFQLYLGKKDAENIIDFTEHKLLRYITTIDDPQQKLILSALVVDYRAGHVAVAWRRGKPVPLRVTKESSA